MAKTLKLMAENAEIKGKKAETGSQLKYYLNAKLA